MKHTTSILLLLLSSSIILTGCSLPQTPVFQEESANLTGINIHNEANTVQTVVSGHETTTDSLELNNQGTILSEQDKQAILEAHPYYKNDGTLRIREAKTIGNYSIGLMEEYNERRGERNSVQFLAGKFDNQRIHLYASNSGDRSCKLISLFGVPRDLLAWQDSYVCHETGGEYTIPKKAYEYYILSVMRGSKEILNNLNSLCFAKYQRECKEEDFEGLAYTISNNESDRSSETEYYIHFNSTEKYVYDIASNIFYRIDPVDGIKEKYLCNEIS